MNENQKELVIKWSIGYIVVITMFAAMYFFEDSLSVIVIIMIIVTLFVGKKYRYDRERSERDVQEFIEYSKQHKAILMAIAVYSISLPLLLYALWKTKYIIIGTNSKSSVLYAGLFALPFFLFDMNHKVHIYKKNESLTEHSNQLDTD
jgi:TctA family transporter